MTDKIASFELHHAWHRLFPRAPWPGEQRAITMMQDEILLLRSYVGDGRMRPQAEVKRAHDLFMQLVHDHKMVEELELSQTVIILAADLLTWVLNHPAYASAFGDNFAYIERQLKKLGYEIAEEDPNAAA